jgi:hypothetical protein
LPGDENIICNLILQGFADLHVERNTIRFDESTHTEFISSKMIDCFDAGVCLTANTMQMVFYGV